MKDPRTDEDSAPKSDVVHARLSCALKERVQACADANGKTLSGAVTGLIERALDAEEEDAALEGRLTAIDAKLDRIAKDCSLASKRAGKASQASLGALALACSIAPDALRFLANEALLRGQVLQHLGNSKAAERVRVPASLGRLANAMEPADVFAMAYSEIGGKLSRDRATSFLPAFASAVSMYGLGELGLLGMDADDWACALDRTDAEAMGILAQRETKRGRHA